MKLRRMLVGIVALALSACAGMGPSLKYKSVGLQNVTLDGATFDLVYALTNPYPIGATLAHVNYALQIEGRDLVTGNPAAGFAVPASATADLHLPVHIKFADIFPAVGTLLTKRSAHYTAKGEIGVKTPIGVVPLPFSQTGEVPIPKPSANQLINLVK